MDCNRFASPFARSCRRGKRILAQSGGKIAISRFPSAQLGDSVDVRNVHNGCIVNFSSVGWEDGGEFMIFHAALDYSSEACSFATHRWLRRPN